MLEALSGGHRKSSKVAVEVGVKIRMEKVRWEEGGGKGKEKREGEE